jgi:enamine deaminase RidA (YjgF/YER057c/UK114 family)
MSGVQRQIIDSVPVGISQAIRVGDTVYCSGQVSGAEGIEAQAREAFGRVQALLAKAGATMADVVKITLYTTDEHCWMNIKSVREEFLKEPYPAATMPVVKALAAPQFLIEVDVIAVVGSGG